MNTTVIRIIISTFIYIGISVIAVFLGRDAEALRKQKAGYIIFAVLSLIYGGFIIWEGINALNKELDLHTKLEVAKQKIITEQSRTNNMVKQLTLATLDMVHPSVYKDYPNFRLGLMWYWLGSLEESSQHFKWQLQKKPSHAPSMYNLAIVSIKKGEIQKAKSLFPHIHLSKISSSQRQLVKSWLNTITDREKTGDFIVEDSLQWKLWQLP